MCMHTNFILPTVSKTWLCAGILCCVISLQHIQSLFQYIEYTLQYKVLHTLFLKFGLHQLCWHNFEHNRLAKALSIMPA